ncbi:MAG: hypothetical protein ABIQ02_15940 [Saprospiraceae bacterium]
MPRFLLAITAFLLTVALSAQVKTNPEIQKKVDAFIEQSNQKKWDEAFGVMYPKLFSRVPKQDLIDLMTSMDQDGLSLMRSHMKLTSSTSPLKEGDETFVKLDYMADLTALIKAGSFYDDPKYIQGMTGQFEATYGKENVKWDAANKTYTIITKIAMMAIKSENEWYLVEINNDQKELMEYLFSESVRKALVNTE